MIRKLRPVAVALVLAFSTQEALTISNALALSGGVCVDDAAQHYFAGQEWWPATGDYNGAQTKISITSGTFWNCGAPFTGNDGSSAWVGMVPGPNSSKYNVPEAIVQVGVLNCDLLLTACNNTLRYFWASGGCNGFTPIAGYLGDATYGQHTYKVDYQSDGKFHYYIDTVDQGHATALSDPTINCWGSQQTVPQYLVERFDKGDSAGSSTSPVQLDFMLYRGATGGFVSLPNQGCSNTRPSGTGHYTCSAGHGVTYGTYAHVYTTY